MHEACVSRIRVESPQPDSHLPYLKEEASMPDSTSERGRTSFSINDAVKSLIAEREHNQAKAKEAAANGPPATTSTKDFAHQPNPMAGKKVPLPEGFVMNDVKTRDNSKNRTDKEAQWQFLNEYRERKLSEQQDKKL